MAFDKLNLLPKGFDAQKTAASLTNGAGLSKGAQRDSIQIQGALFSQFLQPTTSVKPQERVQQESQNNDLLDLAETEVQGAQRFEHVATPPKSNGVSGTHEAQTSIQEDGIQDESQVPTPKAAIAGTRETSGEEGEALSAEVSDDGESTERLESSPSTAVVQANQTPLAATGPLAVVSTEDTALTTAQLGETAPRLQGGKVLLGKAFGSATSELGASGSPASEGDMTPSTKHTGTQGAPLWSELGLAEDSAVGETTLIDKSLKTSGNQNAEGAANSARAAAQSDQAFAPISASNSSEMVPTASLTQTGATVATQSASVSDAPPVASTGYILSQASAESISQLGIQLQKRLSQGTTQFNIELYPADMGRVDVSLQIGKDGKIAAQLLFDSSLSASSFSASEKELRQHLADTGLQIADEGITITSRAPDALKAEATADKPSMSGTRQDASRDAAKGDGLLGQNLDRQNQERQQQEQARSGAKVSAHELFARQNQTADDLSALALIRAGYNITASQLALNLIV